MTTPRVVIADDQALVRAGFRMILASDGIEVVGEAADGVEAIEAVRRTRPDVVLMDIRMPEMDGLEATRRILSSAKDGRRREGRETGGRGDGEGDDGADRHRDAKGRDGADWRPKVLILTTFDLDQYVYAALAAGASGFLLKDVSPEHLVASVRLIRTGDALLAPTITKRLVERFVRPDMPAVSGDRGLDVLTPREREVFTLIARGATNGELAARLHLSEATVKSHVTRILAKLGLRDRVQAVILAYESGLISPSR
jgi:DNA-binding NarL/FixJ family response regulator